VTGNEASSARVVFPAGHPSGGARHGSHGDRVSMSSSGPLFRPRPDLSPTLDDLSALLEEMLAESGGPLTKAERRAADRALGVVSKRTRAGRR
jgi:hypothetical protein